MSVPTEERPAMIFSDRQPPQFLVNPVALMQMAGAIVYGSLYLILVFWTSLELGRFLPAILAIAGAGATYLSFFLQLILPPVSFEPLAAMRSRRMQRMARGVVYVSIALGVLAGLTLLAAVVFR